MDTTLATFAGPGVGNCDVTETCLRQALPGSCQADIDHTGDVAITDLLEVLGAWGPCPPTS